MRLERARFIRNVIEGAEALSAARPEVQALIPQAGHFEYGAVLSNHIRHLLAALLKHKELPQNEQQQLQLKQLLSLTIDQTVAQRLLRKNPIISVSYRETISQGGDIAEISRLENIWWYPGLTTSARYNGCYVPVYNTAKDAVKEAFEYQLEAALHECLGKLLTENCSGHSVSNSTSIKNMAGRTFRKSLYQIV